MCAARAFCSFPTGNIFLYCKIYIGTGNIFLYWTYIFVLEIYFCSGNIFLYWKYICVISEIHMSYWKYMSVIKYISVLPLWATVHVAMLQDGASSGAYFVNKLTLPLVDFKTNVIKWKLHFVSCNVGLTSITCDYKSHSRFTVVRFCNHAFIGVRAHFFWGGLC